MDRINIYIPKDLRQQIKMRAELDHKPEAEVIRNLLEKAVAGDSPKRPRLAGLANLGITGGPPDLASNIDKYLYEND